MLGGIIFHLIKCLTSSYSCSQSKAFANATMRLKFVYVTKL